MKTSIVLLAVLNSRRVHKKNNKVLCVPFLSRKAREREGTKCDKTSTISGKAEHSAR